MSTTVRFPAEWEPQSAVLIAWPHPETDWGPRLVDVEETYIALVLAITGFQQAVICIADDDLQIYAEARLRSARVDMDRVRFVTVEYDDTWLRDSGPITLKAGREFLQLDFRFTGWGGKFEASRDDRLVEALSAQGVFANATREQIDFAGNPTLAGQVIVQNVPSVSTLVTNNTVTGSVTLSYNGLIETVAYTVSGWRETQ